MKQLYFFLLAALLAVSSCKKNGISEQKCSELKKGILADDKAVVGKHVNALIHNLPSSINTQENLNRLAQALSSQCDIIATVLCFNCIETLPAQSEIRLSFSAPGATVSRTMDISYTSDNRMVFSSLHE